MDSKDKVSKLLVKHKVSVLCELGKEKGVMEHEREYYKHVRAYPAKVRGAHPDEYYTAHRWLDSHRKKLQERIAIDFGYMSKRESYPRGKEADLIIDISEAIKDIVGNDIDPILVATVLFKEGLDRFCSDYTNVDIYVKKAIEQLSYGRYNESTLKILEQALTINPHNSDANYYNGSVLLHLGRWKEAIKYFEKSIEYNPAHYLALNDLGFILTEYMEDTKKGFEYAKRALSMTWKGSPDEPAILDTVGWAYYQQEHNLEEAKRYLRESFNLTSSEQQFYITVCYHLMMVLKECNELQEVKELFRQISKLTPDNPVDRESYEKAKKLMQEV